MRTFIAAASLLLLAPSCFAENFSVIYSDANAATPRLNLAIDRDSIVRQGDLVSYDLRWYNPRSDSRVQVTAVANCVTRQRGVLEDHQKAADASLYAVAEGSVLARDVDAACGVGPITDLPAAPEVPSLAAPVAPGKGAPAAEPVFASILESAQLGSPWAQYLVAEMFMNARGTPADTAAAINWYRKAAEHGTREKQYELGVRYEAGWGAPQRDLAEAVIWYRRAAEQGHVDAAYHLAFLYEIGKDVARDDTEEARWATVAAASMPAARHLLAALYREGRGVQKDEAEAQRIGNQLSGPIALKPVPPGQQPAAISSTPRANAINQGCKPDYPRASRLAEEQGNVKVQITITADGQLESVAVLQSSGYRSLDLATVAGLAMCQFKPEIHDGQARRVSFAAIYQWKLEQ